MYFRQLANAVNNVTNLAQWMKEARAAAIQLSNNSNDDNHAQLTGILRMAMYQSLQFLQFHGLLQHLATFLAQKEAQCLNGGLLIGNA